MYLLTANVLDTATITPTPASASDLARLTDLDVGPQYVGAVGAITFDVDLGASPPAVASWALLHHNLSGVTVTLASGPAFPPATARDSVLATGDDLFRHVASVTARFWRLSIPALAGGLAPLIGELLLGTPHYIDDKPTIPTGYPAVVANVTRDRSPAGIPWATQRGPARVRLALEWAGMLEPDLLALLAAYAESDDGARPLLVEDARGAARWMTWMDAELAPEAVGAGLFHVRSTFEEFPI